MIDRVNSPLKVSLRGLSPVSSNIVWVSGSSGSWAVTTDAAETWSSGSYSDTLDFRDVIGFNGQKAILMNAGFPGLLVMTENGGKSWNEVYRNETAGIFFDDLSFMNDKIGVMLGDEMNGRFPIVVTRDGGYTWKMMEEEYLPLANEGEGGFAASGSLMITPELNQILFVTTHSRVISSKDFGANWHYLVSPVDGSAEASGIFSVAFSNQGTLLVVGGDYLKQDERVKNYGYSIKDGPFLSDGKKPLGYRSGVSFVPAHEIAIATGPTGTDISYDSGKNWEALDSLGFHAVKYAPQANVGWLSGSEGRIARLIMTKPQ